MLILQQLATKLIASYYQSWESVEGESEETSGDEVSSSLHKDYKHTLTQITTP